jgi:hypothetical protein
MRIIQQVVKQVSKEMKELIQVVSKIYDEVVNFEQFLNIAIMISYLARS